MAHAGTVHETLSSTAGHAVPPHAASLVTRRVRVRVDVPHVAEHAVHDDQVDTAQATGQHARPQLFVSVSAGHGRPPFSAGRVTVRERDLDADVPHVAVHADQIAQADTAQSTAGCVHAAIVQARDSSVAWLHEPPHDSAALTERVRVKRPLPHVTEHADDAQLVHDVYVQSTGQQPLLAVHGLESVSA